MILKKHTLAISIALSLGLTACSGGNNQFTPVISNSATGTNTDNSHKTDISTNSGTGTSTANSQQGSTQKAGQTGSPNSKEETTTTPIPNMETPNGDKQDQSDNTAANPNNGDISASAPTPSTEKSNEETRDQSVNTPGSAQNNGDNNPKAEETTDSTPKKPNENNQDQSGSASNNSESNNSGSTNENSDNNNTDNTKTENGEDPQIARNKLETSMDPEGKIQWRQLATFIPSSDTSASDPLNDKQNGKISPQTGAAAYVNGDMRYLDGSSVKDFRKDSASTNYNASVMTAAEINPEKIQTLDILNENGQVVAKMHFTNQEYSSYTLWRANASPKDMDVMVPGYVAIPTQSTVDLTSKGKVSYRGHTMAQTAPNSNDVHFGNIELNADFATKKISGKLTNRNDRLLDKRIYIDYPDDYMYDFTTDPEEWEDDKSLTLLTEEQMNEKKAELQQNIEKEQAKYRSVDVNIKETAIKSENGVWSFENPLGALSFQNSEGKTRETGIVRGIFAGSDGQEVTGSIEGSDIYMSFGATEEKK